MTPHKVIYRKSADDDLDEIFSYILQNGGSADSAFYFTQQIRNYCDSFAIFPHRGTRRDDLRNGLRMIGFERRVSIAFTVTDNTVQIARIFYGGRDVDILLEDDNAAPVSEGGDEFKN